MINPTVNALEATVGQPLANVATGISAVKIAGGHFQSEVADRVRRPSGNKGKNGRHPHNHQSFSRPAGRTALSRAGLRHRGVGPVDGSAGRPARFFHALHRGSCFESARRRRHVSGAPFRQGITRAPVRNPASRGAVSRRHDCARMARPGMAPLKSLPGSADAGQFELRMHVNPREDRHVSPTQCVEGAP